MVRKTLRPQAQPAATAFGRPPICIASSSGLPSGVQQKMLNPPGPMISPTTMSTMPATRPPRTIVTIPQITKITATIQRIVETPAPQPAAARRAVTTSPFTAVGARPGKLVPDGQASHSPPMGPVRKGHMDQPLRPFALDHREVLVHPHPVVPGEVAHQGVVPGGQGEGQGLGLPGGHVPGLAHVHPHGVLVEPVLLSL